MSRINELHNRLFGLLNFEPQGGNGGRHGNIVYPPGSSAPPSEVAFTNDIMGRGMRLFELAQAVRDGSSVSSSRLPLFPSEDLDHIQALFIGPDLEAFTDLYETATALRSEILAR